MKVKYNKKADHQVYKLKDGRTVPGSSTISKIYSPQEGLYRWYWNNGKNGLDFKKPLEEAADIGSLAHFLIQCHLEGNEPDVSEFSPNNLAAAQGVFDKFLYFWNQEGLKFVKSEYGLVSEAHGYGGTIDLQCEDEKGRKCIIDYKTNKRTIYSSQIIQLSSYENLENENDSQADRRAICRINKENPEDSEWRWLPPLDTYFKCFLSQLNLYRTFKDAGI